MKKKIWIGLDNLDALDLEDWTDSHEYQGDWLVEYNPINSEFYVKAPNEHTGFGASIKDAIIKTFMDYESPISRDTCGIRD